MSDVKHTINDSLFTMLFEDRSSLKRLVSDLFPGEEVEEDEIKNVTLKTVFMNDIYNDLGFTYRGRNLILIESQATWSMNILPRLLIYLGATYETMIANSETNSYASSKVLLPKPEFYVVYVGDDKKLPKTISLADEFFNGDASALELRAKILYYDPEEKGILNEYMTFCHKYRTYRRLMKPIEALNLTIKECLNENVLKDFLHLHESEVITYMSSIFTQEEATRLWKLEIIRETKQQVTQEVTQQMKEENELQQIEKAFGYITNLRNVMPQLSFEEACDTLGIDEELKSKLRAKL